MLLESCKMDELNAAKISTIEYSPQRFVRELTKPTVGVDGLLTARKAVQNLADETNAQLKKNVYKNYILFIDTAKEISYLKSEMYQLSHMLTEQQTLLSSLMDISIGGDRAGLTASEKKEAAEKAKCQLEEKCKYCFSKSIINLINFKIHI